MLSTFCLHKLSNFARLLKIYWQLLIVALKENRAIFYRSKNTQTHTHHWEVVGNPAIKASVMCHGRGAGRGAVLFSFQPNLGSYCYK